VQRNGCKGEIDGAFEWAMREKGFAPDPARSARSTEKFVPKGGP
jgi:hypothetical protein